MKKTISVLFAIIIIFSLIPNALASQKSKVTTYRTSNNKNNYFELAVSSNRLTISGKCDDSNTQWLWVLCNKDTAGFFKIDTNNYFIEELSIGNYSSAQSLNVEIRGGKDRYGLYNYLFWNSDITLTYSDGSWGFNFNQTVLDNNNLMKSKSQWLNPGQVSRNAASVPQIKTLSDNIVKNASDDYEKVLLIHNWVAENICYDYDYYNGKSTSTSYEYVDILQTKRTVCTGYAFLVQLLVSAQNIPCIVIGGFVQTNGAWSDTSASATKDNHSWNEAWADGRWVNVDATWDSKNRYENGIYTYKDMGYARYFDISDEELSQDHKILYRVSLDARWSYDNVNIPSAWAQDEILTAFSRYLIPYSMQEYYRANITRDEFCKLIINFIEIKTKTNIGMILRSKGLKVNPSTFSDCSKDYVLEANALGIIGGRGNGVFDPYDLITRQEAAVIIKKTAELIGVKPETRDTMNFNDCNTFASWATDSITFVSGITDKTNGFKVMGSIGGNNFSPDGLLTREQAYCSVLRLFNA